ncbi:phage tail tape measure protein [Alicyclobacillus dauci]|uniref:Phage tail tape measure protein n=1 Tax=Alicyclobacillus dauci TaxID=1475485 RepID=A0ABY6ZAB8_9BACL|nr:phage tail tape measure protein [Alicyclobacillus dauci]WAH39201.1 phage tail tape measure protein [Alicyclobacillus dauci]
MNESNVVSKVAARITFDITDAQSKLTQLSDSYKQFNNELKSADTQMQKALQAPSSSGQKYLIDATGQLVSMSNAIKDVQTQWKEGTLAADEYLKKIADIKSAYAENFAPSNPNSMKFDLSYRNALLQAQNDVRNMISLQQQASKQDQKASADEATAQAKSVDERMRTIKQLYDMKLLDAQQSLAEMEKLYDEETQYFKDNLDKQVQFFKTAQTMENASADSFSSKLKGLYSTQGMPGMGLTNPLDLASTMLQFQALQSIFNNLQEGIVGINKGEAGLKQVFGEHIADQQQLNEVTNQFIAIAQQYGQSITTTLDATKQWGRQYTDINTALTLTNSATILSTVDNLKMADANKALEATMNAMGMAATNQATAMTNSMKIVDSWSALAHEASVSAQDLAMGVERSAGAAHVAGMSLDQLNALIAAMIRNTGLSGENAGNALKTIISNISSGSQKVQDAFKQLGIDMYTVGADGQKQLKPVYDLIMQVADATKNADASQTAALKTIAGGTYQYSKFAAMVSDTKTIQDDLTKSMDSTGKATVLVQEQMHTLQAELQRLDDAWQKLFHNSADNGMGSALAGLIGDVTNLVNGLASMNPEVMKTTVYIGAALVSIKLLTAGIGAVANVLGSMKNGINSAMGLFSSFTNMINQQRTGVQTLTMSIREQIAARGAAVLGIDAETTALRGMAIAAGTVDAVMTGLTFGLSLLGVGLAVAAMHAGAASQAMQEQEQQAQQLSSSYAQNKDQIDSLLQKYQQLEQATSNGSVFKDQQQQQEYYSTMQQLAGLIPNVTQYVDQNGNTHIKSAEAIKQEIDQMQKLQQLQAQKTVDSSSSDIQKQLDAIDKLEQKMSDLQAKKSMGGIVTSDGLLPFTKQDLDNMNAQMDQYQIDLQTAKNSLQQYEQQLTSAYLANTNLSSSMKSVSDSILGAVNWSQVTGGMQGYQNVAQQVSDTVKQLNTDLANGKLTDDQYAQAIDSLSQKIPLNKSAIIELSAAKQGDTAATAQNSAATNENAGANNNLSAALTAAEANIKLLDTAQKELSGSHKLSQATLDALTKAYPDFDSAVGGGVNSMMAFINASKAQANQVISDQKTMTEAVIENAKARIQALNDEMAAMLNNLSVGESMSQFVSSGMMNKYHALASQVKYNQGVISSAEADLSKINVASYYVNTATPTNQYSAPKSTGSKTPSASAQNAAYQAPFQDISQQDSQTLKVYEDRIKSLAGPLTQYNDLMNNASQSLQQNNTDTKAASDLVKGYTTYIADLKKQNSDYNDENAKVHQLLPQIQSDINKVNAEFKKGTITDQEHRTALQTLNSEYDNLNSTLNSNSQAIEQNNQKITQATQNMQNDIINILKQGYQEQQQIQEQQLQDQYDAQKTALDNQYNEKKQAIADQIAGIQSQKDAVDALVKSLQDQFQAQDQVNQLTDLQNQLAQVESQHNQEYIDANGKIQYTYDVAKATDLQKQIEDQQTKMAQDAQIKQLQDQSNAYGDQITALNNQTQALDKGYQQQSQDLQNHYNDDKQKLDAYWQYVQSQTRIQQEVEAEIQKQGYQKSLQQAQEYVIQMNAILAQIQQPSISGGSGISSTLSSGGTVNMGSVATTSGVVHMARGGEVPNLAPGIDNVPARLTPGEIVVPSWEDLMRFAQPSASSTNTQTLHIEHLELPNVTDVPSFIDELTGFMQDAAYQGKVG